MPGSDADDENGADPAQDFKLFLHKFKTEAKITRKEVDEFERTTIADVHAAIATIQLTQISSNRQRYLGRLKPFLAGVEQFGKVVEVFLNTSDFVAFIWGPLKFILLIACNMSEALDSLLNAYLEFGELIPQLLAYQEHCRRNAYMRTVLGLMYKDILEFHCAAMRYFRRQTWKQVFQAAWTGFKMKLEELKDNMRRHRHLVESQASIVQFEESQRLRALAETEFRNLHDELIRQRLRTVQAWLAPYNSACDQERYAFERSKCPGSGQWLLTHDLFKSWYDPIYCMNPLLWLNGKPGAGKTVLTSTIVDTIQSMRKTFPARLAYFYCRAGDDTRDNFVAVARSLLSQLLGGNSDLLLQLYEKGNLQSGEAILSDTAMAKSLLGVALDLPTTTYIIIDGIDECDRQNRKEICSFFCQQVDQLPKDDFGRLRCLFVSREDGYAKKDLGLVPSIQMLPAYTHDDIRRYVVIWKKAMEDKYGKIECPMTDIIMSSTRGMFLFAKLVVQFLNALPTREEVIQNLQPGWFPSEIKQLYEKIFARIVADSPESTAKRPKAIRLLGLLAVAKRPLRWYEIQGIFAFDPDDEDHPVNYDARMIRDDPQDLCWSLVERHSDNTVELVHPTVKEYLLRDQNHHIRSAGAEYELLQLCLMFLTMPACTAGETSDAIGEYLRNGYYSFFDYAVACWPLHFQAATSHITSRDVTLLAETLELFLDTHWLDSTVEYPVSVAMNEKMKDFQLFDFYPRLVQAVISARKQLGVHGKGPSPDEPLDLNCVTNDIRVVYEAMNSTGLEPYRSQLQGFYGEKCYKCPRVNCVRFYDGYSLESERAAHIARHERPYNCGDSQCPMFTFGYTTEKSLRRHLFEIHSIDSGRDVEFPMPPREPKRTSQATFRCSQCPKAFTRASNLRNHLRVHSNSKPYKCKTCGRAFSRQSDCVRHEGIHDGKRPYICAGKLQDGTVWGCKTAFSRQYKLRDHFKSGSGRLCISRRLEELKEGISGHDADVIAAMGHFDDVVEKPASVREVTESPSPDKDDAEMEDVQWSMFLVPTVDMGDDEGV